MPRAYKKRASRARSGLSLVGFSSSGLLRRMSLDLGVLLFPSRWSRRPRFRYEAAQHESIPSDQRSDNRDDPTSKTTEHARVGSSRGCAAGDMGLGQGLSTAHWQIRIDLAAHADRP